MPSATAESSPELDLLIGTTRAFLDRDMPLTRVRELHASGQSFDRQWWKRAAELGWTALLIPESLGGGSITGCGINDLMRLLEQLGRTVAPGPLIPVSVVASALAEADAAHQTIVDGLLDGSVVAAWAVDEPGQPFGSIPATTATPTAQGYRINGVKDRVEGGVHCDVLLVSALCPDGVAQFLVPAEARGVSVVQSPTVDLVRDYATVDFDGVEVESAAIVGSVAAAPVAIARQTYIAALLQCAETVGALDAIFDMTVLWAQERTSFGRPLSSYQALKHRFADMKTQLEACRAILAAARRAFTTEPETAGLAVSAAKAYIGEYSIAIAQECVQLHGGIGVTWEHDLHVYLRRIEVNRALFGTTEEHQENVYRYVEQTETSR